MRIKKNILAMVMAGVLSISCLPAAFAANVNAPGTGETPVTITAAATTFDVMVPTSITIHLNADGTVTCPDASAVKIVNNSAGAVKVTDVTVKDSAWTIVSYNGGDRSTLAASGVDSKKLGMQFTAGGTTIATSTNGDHSIGTNPANWKMTGTVTAGTTNELPITCAAIASAVSAAIDSGVTAANVVFTLAWDI